jgi:serine/threonine protein kinase
MPELKMPHRFSSEQHQNHDPITADLEFTNEADNSSTRNMWGRTWHKVENWLKKDGDTAGDYSKDDSVGVWKDENEKWSNAPFGKRVSALSRSKPKLARQDSEMRDRLCVYEPNAEERRAVSVGRRTPSSQKRSRSLSPPPYSFQPSHSAPDVSHIPNYYDEPPPPLPERFQDDIKAANLETSQLIGPDHELKREPSISAISLDEDVEGLEIQDELQAKWILNLSMHFKDRSDREKFFITYAEHPNRWRRITISIDYRNPGIDSLESDLKSLKYQRDKSARIYESIRDSLLDIQFYPTVTNLKLKTMDGRLHVHCSEDLNEIIPYPKASMLQYLPFPVYKEADVLFESHISGFVYKVNIDGRIMVKKEIPGPESVDEFLYEVAALSALRDADHVINFEGLVVDDTGKDVKGLLISLASKGALVDLIYDGRHAHSLPWSRREKWARQIVKGLSEVHEAGFVQGDFTLSNIVADEEDDVWLIDINRRGCPVGWEPPELEALIRAGQHISMFIGVKTDLFQLGMVLWALAMCIDEPELEARPLVAVTRPDVPEYFRRMVESCLETDQRKRHSAIHLLSLFPPETHAIVEPSPLELSRSTIQPEIETTVVEPETLLTIRPNPRDIGLSAPSQVSEISSINTTGLDTVASSEYLFDSQDIYLNKQLVRDSSPMTQSDSERPHARDNSEFDSSINVSSIANFLPLAFLTPTKTAESTLSTSESGTIGLATPDKQEEAGTPPAPTSSETQIDPLLQPSIETNPSLLPSTAADAIQPHIERSVTETHISNVEPTIFESTPTEAATTALVATQSLT